MRFMPSCKQMAIYVQVGSETIAVTGAEPHEGMFEATPIAFEVLREQVAASIARQTIGHIVPEIVVDKSVDVTPCQAILSDDPVEWCGGGMTGRAVSDGRDLGLVPCSSEQTPIASPKITVDNQEVHMVMVVGRREDGRPLVEVMDSSKVESRDATDEEIREEIREKLRPFTPLSGREVGVAEQAFAAGKDAGTLNASGELADMIRGLARAAAFLELVGSNDDLHPETRELWDDECRAALAEARRLGLVGQHHRASDYATLGQRFAAVTARAIEGSPESSCPECGDKTIELTVSLLPGQEQSKCPSCGRLLWKFAKTSWAEDPFAKLDAAGLSPTSPLTDTVRRAVVAKMESSSRLRSGKFVSRRPRATVEAIQWTGDNFAEVEAWLLANGSAGVPRAESVKLMTDDLSPEPASVVAYGEDGRTTCPKFGWFVEPYNGEIFTHTNEQFDKYYVTVLPDEVLTAGRWAAEELVQWRVWASELTKSDPVLGDDGVLRKKITAVVEAPAVISVDEVPLKDYDGLKSFGAIDPAVVFEDIKVDHFPVQAFETPPNMLWSDIGKPPKLESESKKGMDDLVVEACARVAHSIYREAIDDSTMLPWDEAPEDERDVARETVRGTLRGTTPEQWHVKWRAEKEAEGWTNGPDKDEERKMHPNLVHYDQLPEEQRAIDRLFVVAVEATRQAIDNLEVVTAAQVPVFKVKGDVTPEQFTQFKRDWDQEQQIGSAWKTPIVVEEDLQLRRPVSPYTVGGVVTFIDQKVDSMLTMSMTWGSLREVELQVLLMLEVREFVLTGRYRDSVMEAYARFIAGKLGDTASVEPLSTQLEALGRAAEFTMIMGEFIRAMCAMAPSPRPVPARTIRMTDFDARLYMLFKKHCECRPVNTARMFHSHDCDTAITNDVRTILHRVVEPGPDEMTKGEQRAATDEEVRAARRRLAVDDLLRAAKP